MVRYDWKLWTRIKYYLVHKRVNERTNEHSLHTQPPLINTHHMQWNENCNSQNWFNERWLLFLDSVYNPYQCWRWERKKRSLANSMVYLFTVRTIICTTQSTQNTLNGSSHKLLSLILYSSRIDIVPTVFGVSFLFRLSIINFSVHHKEK